MPSVARTEAWKALAAHRRELADLNMREMFAADPGRFTNFSIGFEDILLDYSKNRVTAATMRLLFGLAAQADLKHWTERMFAGERINVTEDRPVLHVALRNRSNRPILVDGKDVTRAAHSLRA